MAEQERHLLFKIKPALAGDQVADAVDVENGSTGHTGLLANAENQQQINDRLDATGLGAQPRVITGSFAATSGNIGTWYGGRQTVIIETDRAQGNGNYTFTLPSIDELNTMFDDMVTRGLGEVYTVTLIHRSGSTASLPRNSLTIRNPTVSALFNPNEIPTTLAQGASATFRITRQGASISPWERVTVEAAADPVAVFGSVAIQSISWNNRDGSLLPQGAQVQQGYAFPVANSTPNDGTLRQGLLDSGVSDRFIYDGDFVVWTAAAFTSWGDGGNWFVLSADDMRRMGREAHNFLLQVREIDNRVDVGPVSAMASNALAWLSENPLAEAPFLIPSTDTGNPRAGDSYPYIGGQENRDAGLRFQFSQNRFGAFLTLGISPSFLASNAEEDIFIRVRDESGDLVETLSLADDFTLRDDATFTNGTVTHFVRNTSFNYAFLETIEIVLTVVQRHFRFSPDTVDVTGNIANDGLTEPLLSPDVRAKLNANLQPDNARFQAIESRLSPFRTVTIDTPDHRYLFASSTGTDPFPSDLSALSQVSAESPRFSAPTASVFISTVADAQYVLNNVTQDTVTVLDQGQAGVDLGESVSYNGQTYFVYRVSGLTVNDVVEVDSFIVSEVLAWPNDIKTNAENIAANMAMLDHAVLNLPAPVVDVLKNEVSVNEENAPSVAATAYNKGLGGTSQQTVFFEDTPQVPAGGALRSDDFNKSAAARVRQKLVYFPSGTAYTNQGYLWAFDGTTQTDLITYANGSFMASVLVPSVPAGSETSDVYPAPPNLVSGAGIWINIPALTFVNGVPVAEADEIFFTRNVPQVAESLTIQYRGHANGNVFGTASGTLAGVGGSSDVATTFTLNTGGETATVEVLWRAAQRDIRVSVTESLTTGLPTINDVEVILSYQETRTVPAVPEGVREVVIEFEHPGGQVFAIRPSATGTVILVGDRVEIDTGYLYTDIFSSGESGHLSTPVTTGAFYDYQDVTPIPSTITDLENHATLPQYGLFETLYTHETIVGLGTQLTVLDAAGVLRNVGEVLSDLLTRVAALESP